MAGTQKCKFFIHDENRQCSNDVVREKAGGIIHYGDVCYYHGGKKQKIRLRRELMDMLLHKAVNQYAANKREVAPEQALLELVQESAANVDWLRDKISKLQIPAELTFDITDPPEAEELSYQLDDREHPRTQLTAAAKLMLSAPASGGALLYGPNHVGNDTPHVLIQMYNDERDKLAKYCKIAVEANLAERLTSVEERKLELIAKVMNKVFESESLSLTQKQLGIARKLTAKGLRVLAGGKAS